MPSPATLVDPGRRSEPALVGLDWGTSSLRGYLIGTDGGVIESRARPWGIQHVPEGDFAAAFRDTVGDWRTQWPQLPAIAAGMIGSRQGWHEAPYIHCPADAAAIAAGLISCDAGCGGLSIVPGVLQPGSLPNVLRGEETQIFGAIAAEPALAADSLFVLPGTHCKWATIRDGRIFHFATYMTGELFAVLREHSLLGKPAREAGPSDPGGTAAAAAFHRGLLAARESGAQGIASRLFTTRSLYLTGDLSAAQTLDYLSGLLMGEELRSVIAELDGKPCPPLVFIGDAALCERYRDALAVFGIDRVRLFGDSAAMGLWRIAAAAGLVAAPRTEPGG